MPAHMTSGRGVNLLNYKWKTMPKVEYSTQQINEGTHSRGQANPLGKSSEGGYPAAELQNFVYHSLQNFSLLNYKWKMMAKVEYPPIKDTVSIQKLFFQFTTMVHFCKISSIFGICV